MGGRNGCNCDALSVKVSLRRYSPSNSREYEDTLSDNDVGAPSAAESTSSGPKARKARLSQEDVPGYSLEQATKVAQAIADSNAYKPTRPLAVAQAMNFTPSSGGFRGMTGAAVAYGLTTGAYNSSEIGLTPIGLRIVRPTSEGDDLAAKREALLRPRVIGDFLRHFDGAALPADAIARNVLVEKGVPSERTNDVLSLILDGASTVGFIREWSGKRFVDLAGAVANDASSTTAEQAPNVPLRTTAPSTSTAAAVSAPTVALSSGVNINIEIHIAADASTSTIEDIFRSMQRYVLRPDSATENDE